MQPTNLKELVAEITKANGEEEERLKLVDWLKYSRPTTAPDRDRLVLAAFVTEKGEYVMQLAAKKPAIRILFNKEPVQTFKQECCMFCLFRECLLCMIRHHETMQSIAANPGKPDASSPWAKS